MTKGVFGSTAKSVFNSTKWELKRSKLAVLVPCRDMLHTAFSKCLIEMVKFNTLQGIDTHVVYNSSTVLLTQREHLADEALSIGAEYTLWLDSDMVFPETTAVRLMSHKKDVVVCNYVKRQPPFKGVAYPKIGDWENPLNIVTSQDLVPVEGVGMGCFMHKTALLNEIKKPYFEFGWTPKSNDWLGEDMIFCQKIARTNRQIFVDTQLSLEMRHLGTWAFGPTIVGLQ